MNLFVNFNRFRTFAIGHCEACFLGRSNLCDKRDCFAKTARNDNVESNGKILRLIFFVSIIFLVGCASLSLHPRLGSVSPAQSLYDKAQKLYQGQKYEAAQEYFHEFLAGNPDEPLRSIAMYYLGHCYQMMGDIKEAKSLYHRIVTNATGDEFWIGVARKRLEELEK